MIYSLRGTLVHLEPNLAVLECAGVGVWPAHYHTND